MQSGHHLGLSASSPALLAGRSAFSGMSVSSAALSRFVSLFRAEAKISAYFPNPLMVLEGLVKKLE
jgi:hypothetical protein